MWCHSIKFVSMLMWKIYNTKGMLIESNNEYYQWCVIFLEFRGTFKKQKLGLVCSLDRGFLTSGIFIWRQRVAILLSRRGVGVLLSWGRIGKLLTRGWIESRGSVWHARIVLSRVRLCRVHTGYCVCCKFKHFIDEKIKILNYLHSDEVLKPWWNNSLNLHSMLHVLWNQHCSERITVHGFRRFSYFTSKLFCYNLSNPTKIHLLIV